MMRRLSQPLGNTAGRRFVAATSSNNLQDKIITGAAAALVSSGSVIAVFHLFVVPLSGTLALATIGCAGATGSLCAFEGGEGDSGTTFGTVAGLLIGGMGGYYAKSSTEPWRK